MSDIFDEVEQDLRRDKAQVFWARYWPVFAAIAAAVIIGVGGWRLYNYLEEQKAAAAGAQFENALKLSRDSKTTEAEAALQALLKDAPAGYRTMARFRLAAELSAHNKPEAVKAYDALAADTTIGQLFQDVAAVRAAMLLVDTVPTADLATRLNRLAAPGQAMRHTARELIGLSAYRSGDVALAETQFSAIQSDSEAPAGVKSRAEFMLTLIAGLPAKS